MLKAAQWSLVQADARPGTVKPSELNRSQTLSAACAVAAPLGPGRDPHCCAARGALPLLPNLETGRNTNVFCSQF